MRNWIKHAVIALIMVSAGSPAFSFATDEFPSTQIGTCTVNAYVQVRVEYAVVFLVSSGSNVYAGGSAWNPGGVRESRPPITEAAIASCFGLLASDVALVQDGANDTFAQDDLMGFGFKLGVAVGGYAVNEYVEFKVGTGSLTPPPNFILSDADATLSAVAGVDASRIATTIDSTGEALGVLDFTLTDGGTADV